MVLLEQLLNWQLQMTVPQTKLFVESPLKRDIVFIFGAGASYPEGVPLQRDILPLIISDRFSEIITSEIGKDVVSFIKSNFDINKKARYPKLEAVFGFMDYFISQEENLSNFYMNSYILNIK